MSTFDDREKGYENKYAHDQQMEFKATVRRNKLLGMWVAELIGLSGEEAEEYAKGVVKSDFEEPGDEDVFRKLRKDLDDHNIDQSDHQIRRRMEELMAVAVEQVRTEG